VNYWHSITIILGIIACFWGVWASFKAQKPVNIVGSILAPIGLLAAIIGTLLLCVPDFFS
jgi:uncharacterized membrane protein